MQPFKTILSIALAVKMFISNWMEKIKARQMESPKQKSDLFPIEKSRSAILCFDISGFTELLSLTEKSGSADNYQEVCKLMALFFRAAYRASFPFGGKVINRMGDGGIILIKGDADEESIDLALHCAESLKRYYHDHFIGNIKKLNFINSTNNPIKGLKLAIHIGEIYRFDFQSIFKEMEEAKYDYLSHHLNLCSRIMDHEICRNNDFSFSEQAWGLIPPHLIKSELKPPEVQCISASLKGIGTELIYSVQFESINWYAIEPQPEPLDN